MTSLIVPWRVRYWARTSKKPLILSMLVYLAVGLGVGEGFYLHYVDYQPDTWVLLREAVWAGAIWPWILLELLIGLIW